MEPPEISSSSQIINTPDVEETDESEHDEIYPEEFNSEIVDSEIYEEQSYELLEMTNEMEEEMELFTVETEEKVGEEFLEEEIFGEEISTEELSSEQMKSGEKIIDIEEKVIVPKEAIEEIKEEQSEIIEEEQSLVVLSEGHLELKTRFDEILTQLKKTVSLKKNKKQIKKWNYNKNSIKKYHKLKKILEPKIEEGSSDFVPTLQHKVTDAPTIIYFYTYKDKEGHQYCKPIRLPLENIETKKIYRNIPAGGNVQGKFDTVPFIQVKGTVTVTTRDNKGNLTKMIHEAGYEYPEIEGDSKGSLAETKPETDSEFSESEDEHLMKRYGFDEYNYDIGKQPLDAQNIEENSTLGILWDKGAIVKLTGKERLVDVKLEEIRKTKKTRTTTKEREKQFRTFTKYLIYMSIHASLKARAAELFVDIKKYSKMSEKSESILEKQKYKKLFFEHILQYRNLRDKFKDVFIHNMDIINEETKKFEEMQQKASEKFAQLVEAEQLLMSKITPALESVYGITKSRIEHLFKLKLLKISAFRESNVDYWKKLYRLVHITCDRQELLDAHKDLDLEQYHELQQKKRLLETLYKKSEIMLGDLRKSYKKTVRSFSYNFDEKEKFIDEVQQMDPDDISVLDEKRRNKLSQLKHERGKLIKPVDHPKKTVVDVNMENLQAELNQKKEKYMRLTNYEILRELYGKCVFRNK